MEKISVYQLNHVRSEKTKKTFGVPTGLSERQEVLESLFCDIRAAYTLR